MIYWIAPGHVYNSCKQNFSLNFTPSICHNVIGGSICCWPVTHHCKKIKKNKTQKSNMAIIKFIHWRGVKWEGEKYYCFTAVIWEVTVHGEVSQACEWVKNWKYIYIYFLSNGGKEVHASEYGVIKRGMKKIGKN